MFRDLKEYQEIAKIYTEKVSKPENLDERRGSSVEQLKQNRADAIPNKPAPAPQKGAGGGTGNPTNTRGTGRKDFEFKKPNTSASNKRAQMSIKRRTPVNTDSTGKRIPTTAEIRAKAKGKVGGGNAGASTDSGGTSMAAIKQKASSSMEAGAFDAKDSSSSTPAVSDKTKQGKPRTKAQMMAAKRIASGKTIADVKKSNTDAMKAKAKERFEKFKADREAKRLERMKEEYTPYDLVLEYLLSTEQVATIEEANYVMTEMDAETIQSIVEMDMMKMPVVNVLGGIAGAVGGTVAAAKYLGRKAGERSIKKTEPKKPGLIKTIKDRTDATNKAIKEMP